jgi:cytochrome c-type biogenesis protein CcmH
VRPQASGVPTPLRRFLPLLLVLALVLVAVPSVSAQDVYSEKTLEISRKLSCPVCAGQTVAESNSPIARQMRATIEQKVQAGESERQIIDFFVARYGESIVTEPPKSGFSLGLWWMPVVVVVLAATVVALFVRERTRSASVTASASNEASVTDDELEAIAREVLGTPGDERMSRA